MSTETEPGAPIRRQVLTASIWVTSGMLLGRLAGIIREFLIADTFGVTRDADVAILLVTGPEVLVTIAGSGAVGLVLIPILLENDIGSQLQLVRRLTVRLGAVAVIIAIIAAVLVITLGSAWATEGDLTRRAFSVAVVVTAFAVPFSMLVVITAAFLRAQNRFAAVSLATLTFTLPILVAIVAFRSVVGVALGIAVGGTLRYGIQTVLIARGWDGAQATGRPRLSVKRSDVATSFGISVMQAAQVSLPILVVAVLGDEGDVALLNYGWRVLLIPIGLLASIFSVAAYPTLVRLLNEPNGSVTDAVASILRPIILLSVAVGAWLWVNASAAMAAVYGPAGLDSSALAEISSEIRAGAVAIPLLTIGTAATTLLFGLKQSRLGLIPYVIATITLLGAGVVWLELAGPAGLVAAMSVYGLLFSLSATMLLRRSQSLAVLRRNDWVVVVMAAAWSLLAAAVSRALLPGRGFAEVVVNGLLFIGCCAGGYTFAIGRHRSRTDPSA